MKKNSDICTAKRNGGCTTVVEGVPFHKATGPNTNLFLTKMTKAEIVNEISRTTGLEKAAVLAIVENFMDVVKEAMAGGQNVYLRGFGSFIIKTRKEKIARNISKNTSIKVPEHKIPAFKPSKVFLGEVK